MALERIRSPQLPPQLNGLVLTDERRAPRYWATVWEALHGGGLSSSTLAAKLLAIDRFYRSVREQTGTDCLDRMIGDADFDRLESCLEGFFVHVRNAAAHSSTDRTIDWRAALEFVRDLFERRSRSDGTGYSFDLLQSRLLRLQRLYASLTVSRQPKVKAMRALPAGVVEDLYSVADPTSGRNPFRSEGQRWRNYALFLLYLHQGLRRGEALILPLDAIKEDFDAKIGGYRKWIDVTDNGYEEEDPRHTAPGIKTALSHRQIPIADGITHIVQHYIDNYRGRQKHTFLFASNRHRPLALPTVNLMFDGLSGALSPAAKTELRNHLHTDKVTPHDCRHTCAVIRLAEFVAGGMEMDLALQNMRVFFGWTKDSEMPRHYARAYFEDRLISVWQNKFDDRVYVLRAIHSLQQNPEAIGQAAR